MLGCQRTGEQGDKRNLSPGMEHGKADGRIGEDASCSTRQPGGDVSARNGIGAGFSVYLYNAGMEE